jgi:hypothetical protein
MDARGSPAAAGRGARWKRVGIGCLAMLGIGATLGLLAAGVFVVRRHPRILEELGETAKATKRAESSPASEELNRSLCTEALVFAMEDVDRFSHLLGKSVAEGKPAGDLRWLVSCRVRDAGHAPGCDRVAHVFRQTTTERGKYLVVVSAGLVRGADRPLCSAAYDEDGKLMRRVRESGSAVAE